MIWNSSLLLRRISSISLRKFIVSCKSCAAKAGAVAVKNTVIETAPSVAKDIILYKFDSPRFYKYLNIFAISQYGFWMFICSSSFTLLDIPVPETTKEQEEDQPFWRKINLGSDKYKYGLAIGSACMGFGILFISWTYILRTVRYLVMRKDGQTIAFVTYTPFGKNRIMDVPLKHISAEGSRTSGASQLPVKVKGKQLYYLLDLKSGKFPNPQLFDRTVGTKRKLN